MVHWLPPSIKLTATIHCLTEILLIIVLNTNNIYIFLKKRLRIYLRSKEVFFTLVIEICKLLFSINHNVYLPFLESSNIRSK